MKKIFEKIRDGLGFGVGLVLVFGILFGVYAFVEPTQGPNAGSNYLTSTSSLIKGTLDWNDCNIQKGLVYNLWSNISCQTNYTIVNFGCGGISLVETYGLCSLNSTNTLYYYSTSTNYAPSIKCCRIR